MLGFPTVLPRSLRNSLAISGHFSRSRPQWRDCPRICPDLRLSDIAIRVEAARAPSAVSEVTPLAEQIADLLRPKPKIERRGRKAIWDWNAAKDAVWGQLYRGDAKPEKLADVERLLGDWFGTNCGDSPGTTSLREKAREIWTQLQQA